MLPVTVARSNAHYALGYVPLLTPPSSHEADAVRQAAEHSEHVTPEHLDAALAAIEARLTWRFAGAILAQTIAMLGGMVAILRLLG